MHEFAIVESVVRATLTLLANQGIGRGEVATLHFRRGSTFSEDALRLTFEALSQGTILESADLIIDTVDITCRCACGYEQIVGSDDLIGHMFLCPACGTVQEAPGVHDLELIEILLTDTGRPLPSEKVLEGGGHAHGHVH